MSFQAMAWAVKMKLPPKEKLLLLMLANYASNQTGDCYPSINTLCDDTGMSKSSVIRALQVLESARLIGVNRRSVEGINLPNFYRLNLDVGSVSLTPGVSDSDGGSVTRTPGLCPADTRGGVTMTPKPVIEPINETIKNRTRFRAELVELPDFIDRRVWTEWVEFRRQKRSPLTELSVRQQLQALGRWHVDGMDTREIIVQSIRNGWIGLFPEKGDRSSMRAAAAKANRDFADLFAGDAQ